MDCVFSLAILLVFTFSITKSTASLVVMELHVLSRARLWKWSDYVLWKFWSLVLRQHFRSDSNNLVPTKRWPIYCRTYIWCLRAPIDELDISNPNDWFPWNLWWRAHQIANQHRVDYVTKHRPLPLDRTKQYRKGTFVRIPLIPIDCTYLI